MKKFTKISMIIVAVMAGVGILLCGIASLMGAGFGTMRQMAREGAFQIGNWDADESGVHFNYDSDDEQVFSTEFVNDGTEEQSMEFALADVKNLKLDIEAAGIYVEESDSTDQITVTLERGKEKYYECGMDGDTLKVKYDTNSHYSTNNYHGPLITIEIPKGASFETLDFDIGAAETHITVSQMTCKKLKVDVGAGTLDANDFSVSEKADVTIGAGTVAIEDGEYGGLKLDCGMGTFTLGGTVNGDIKGHCGMGSVELNLAGEEEDYNYDLSCGMGNLEINGNNYSIISGTHKESNAGAIGTISLDCGMGNIQVNIN